MSEFGGREVIMVPETLVWRPDTIIYNCISQEEVIDEQRRLVQIESNGAVTLSNPSVYTTRCKLNIARMPFDDQRCTVNISSWAYDLDEMNITTDNVGSEMTNNKFDFVGNSEWDIKAIEVMTKDVKDTERDTYAVR
ncbi:hypothetical protein WR25_17035 [Diploscapter pachys]|uniref:Neurotransmitter-gated ion-channel ligand-binding domain-containing protein n=1 Tax=Diploscapter pachys TaxID=2018661 RepID=A0A2A2KJM4_9BILA|nr:hypothetical protein WR25_17035 [Diploscapter pachys]